MLATFGSLSAGQGKQQHDSRALHLSRSRLSWNGTSLRLLHVLDTFEITKSTTGTELTFVMIFFCCTVDLLF